MDMNWKKSSKILLFISGMTASLAAGHLFYLERFVAGVCFFALTALFLFYAVAEIHLTPSQQQGDNLDADTRKALADLSLLVAENALNAPKWIGRTMPCSSKEINDLEESLTPLLSSFGVDREERERIAQEFDKLRIRSRQDEGRRALLQGKF